MTVDEAVVAIQRAVRGAAPAEIHAAAIVDGATVPGKKFGSVDVKDAYPDGAALFEATMRGDPGALGASLRGLAVRDGEALVDAALVLASEGPKMERAGFTPARVAGELRRAASFALAHSTSDRALDFLMSALDNTNVPRNALARSVHPAASARVRAVLAETGVTMFPVRQRPTLQVWRALTDEDRRALLDMQPRGAPPPELQRAQNAIGVLGSRDDVDSLELIIRMFETHPDDRIRLACAHALAASKSTAAHAIVDARWADADSTVSTIFVRASLFRDLATAWHRFLTPVQAVLDRRHDTPIEEIIVGKLLYACHGGTYPRKIPADQDPLVVEPRLVDLAARLRRHASLGPSARMVLEILPRDVAIASIERYPHTPPVLARVSLPERRDFVARYASGEHGVWDELVQNALAIAQHDELRAEAHAVAVEIMKRVRHNTNAVRATLRESGARVADDAPPATAAELARFTELVGPLPVALDAFWRVVGSIALIPGGDDRYHYGVSSLEDEISLIACDPLEVASACELDYIAEQYEDAVADSHPEIVGPLALDFAPDYIHKQNMSGGAPYSIELPPPTLEDAVDPFVDGERYRLRFVEYLRHAFRFGGFPLLEVAALPIDRIYINDRVPFKRVTGSWNDAADRLLKRLRRDLIEL